MTHQLCHKSMFPDDSAYLPLFQEVIRNVLESIAKKVQITSHDSPNVEDVSTDNLECGVLRHVPARVAACRDRSADTRKLVREVHSFKPEEVEDPGISAAGPQPKLYSPNSSDARPVR